jgi:hypothetical protein
VLAVAAFPRPSHATDCVNVPGDWNWSINAVVTFKTDHTVLLNATPFGRWECTNPRADVVTVNWTTGFLDTMTFNGDKASSRNQLGIQTTGTKISRPVAAAGTSAPASRPAAGPSPAPAVSPASQGSIPIVMASGAVQKCLGISPGVLIVIPATPAMTAYCGQLPAADQYDLAGARFRAGDHAGAVRILLGAAHAGNVQAQSRLALMYDTGDGTARDFKAATMWYGRAAAQGDPDAQVELGYAYEDGDGVPEN